jgi:hypothetical protein
MIRFSNPPMLARQTFAFDFRTDAGNDDALVSMDSYIRVVDESGENYIYPSDFFVGLSLPATAMRRVTRSNPERSSRHWSIQRSRQHRP